MLISSAFAAEAAHQAAHHSESVFGSGETWVAIAFLIVVLGAAKPVFKALTSGLDDRTAKIRARLEEAAKLREESEAILAEYQRKQREAMKDAEDIIAHANAEAQRLAEQAARDLEASLKRREAQALERIAQAESNAIKEVKDAAIDLAINAVHSILAQQVQSPLTSTFADKSIAELPSKFH